MKSFFFRRNVKGFLMNGHQQAVKLDISSLNFKIHFISLPFWVRIIAWRPLRNFSLWGCQVFRSLFPKRYFNTFCYFQIFLNNLLVWVVPSHLLPLWVSSQFLDQSYSRSNFWMLLRSMPELKHFNLVTFPTLNIPFKIIACFCID